MFYITFKGIYIFKIPKFVFVPSVFYKNLNGECKRRFSLLDGIIVVYVSQFDNPRPVKTPFSLSDNWVTSLPLLKLSLIQSCALKNNVDAFKVSAS